MDIRGSLAIDEIEALLEAETIPMRVATRTPAGHPWMLSLWFEYAGGRLLAATAASADVVAHIENDPEVAFEVSTNDVPYRGVRGRGSATIEPDREKAQLRSLMQRYLGGTDSPLARRLLADDREEVRIAIEPALVYGWDFTERMRGATG